MKIRLLHIGFIVCSQFCAGQDINYSNIHLVTQLYNPALAASNFDLEASVNYRSQWKSANSSFASYGATFATTLMPKRRKQQGNLTVGVNFYREEMNNDFSATSALMTTSYHIFLSRNSQLSAGINYGLFNLNLNPDNGEWASQHDGTRYNANIPSGEMISFNQLTKFDAGAGLQYALLNDKITPHSLQIGVAGFHVNQPKFGFVGNSTNRLPMRFVVHGQFAVPLGKKGSYLQGNFSYQQQSTFKTTTIGAIAAVKLKERAKSTSSFSKVDEWYTGIGCAIRTKDAFILNIFVQKSNWNLAFAYDFTTSHLKRTNNSRGAMELVLQYNISSFQQKARY